MWIELTLVLFAVLVVWLSAHTQRVPNPRLISESDIDDRLKEEISRLGRPLMQLGFEMDSMTVK